MIASGFSCRRLAYAALASLALALPLPAAAEEPATYAPSGAGTRLLERGEVILKMLVEEVNLGGSELEAAELTLPVSYGQGPEHVHGRLEVLYVLSGVLGHTVNGVAYRIEPGMVAIVRPGDKVAHAVLSDEPVEALVVWAPGGEARSLVEDLGFAERPLPE